MGRDIEVYHEILGRIADALPPEFFEKLSGGIILLEEAKVHPKQESQPLYILGEYHHGNIGRQIRIYYGSFERVHRYATDEALEKALEHTLMHEFRHHFESLSGLRDLEVEDEVYIEDYLKRNQRDHG